MPITPVILRSAYNYDMDAESERTGLKCKDKSLTQQEFAEEADINFIAERFGLTGEVPQVLHVPTYGDFSGIFDFQTAANSVRAAQESFMQLPAKIRARFNNDPQQLLEFIDDKANLEEAIKLGLAKTPDVPPQPAPAAPTIAPVANPPTP